MTSYVPFLCGSIYIQGGDTSAEFRHDSINSNSVVGVRIISDQGYVLQGEPSVSENKFTVEYANSVGEPTEVKFVVYNPPA